MARTLRRRYGARYIFFATDDPTAVRECKGGAGFTCVAFAGVSSHNSVQHQNSTESNASERTLQAMLDVDTLARCDVFVGTFSTSQMSTVAYELLVTRRGSHVPFINFGHWTWGDGGFA